MRVCIASNDSLVTTTLRTCLQRLGIDCPASRVVSHESMSLLPPPESMQGDSIAFFASGEFTPEALGLLRQLCLTNGDNLKIVVVGVNLTPPVILHAIRSGASDCLDINRNLEAELGEVLQRFAASQNGSRTGRMFTVIASGGGAGATFVAVNLAAALAQRGMEAGLLDLHIRGGDAAAFLNCTPRHTLAALAAKNEQLDLAMFEQSLIQHDSGIQLLASPEPFSDFRSIRTELIPRVVQLARHALAHVIVDLEGCDHDEQVRVLAASDRIVHIVRPDFASVHRARKFHDFLARAKVSREHVTLVANRLGGPKSLDAHLIEETLAIPVEHRLPEEPDAVNRSINLGVPVVLVSPSAKISQALLQLTDSLTGEKAPTDHEGWPRRQIRRLKSTLTRH